MQQNVNTAELVKKSTALVTIAVYFFFVYFVKVYNIIYVRKGQRTHYLCVPPTGFKIFRSAGVFSICTHNSFFCSNNPINNKLCR